MLEKLLKEKKDKAKLEQKLNKSENLLNDMIENQIIQTQTLNEEMN